MNLRTMNPRRPFCGLRNSGGVMLLAARHCGRCPVVVRKCNTNTDMATTNIFTGVVDVTGIWFRHVGRWEVAVVGRVVVLNSNVTSRPMRELNKGALLRCTRAPCVSVLTGGNGAKELVAMPSNFLPNSRITGDSVVNCSRGRICRKHNPLRTTDVNCRLGPASLTLHYGVVGIRSNGVVARGNNGLRARSTSMLVGCLGRALKGSCPSMRFMANVRCHRLLIIRRNGGRVRYTPPRSRPGRG